MTARSIGPSFALSFALLCFAAPRALGEEVTHSVSLSSAPFGPLWGGGVPVAVFDPSLGELQTVRVELRVDALGMVRVENLGSSVFDVRGSCRAEARISLSGASLGAPLGVNTREFHDALAAFDGQLDFKGASGQSHERLTASETRELVFAAADPAFARFAGPGPLVLDLSASATIAPTGSARLATDREYRGSLTLSVTYVFVPLGVTARDDAASTCAGLPVAISALANDTVGGGALDCAGVTVVLPPAHGTVQWTAGATDCAASRFDYEPAPGFTGTDVFTYSVPVAGGGLPADTATVVVTVLGGPATSPDAANLATCIQSSIVVSVLENDAWSGEVLELVSAPANGSASVEVPQGGTSGAPCVRYTPAVGFAGQDAFAYRLTGGASCPSGVTWATVQVVAPVVAEPDSFALCASAGPYHVVDVLSNDSSGGTGFPGGAVTILTPPTNAAGTVTALPDGTVAFVPATGFRGNFSFEYAAANVAGCSATAQAAVQLEAPPLAQADTFAVLKDQPAQLNILDNDVLETGAAVDCATLQLVAAPLHGSAVVQGCNGIDCTECRIVYTPDAGYVGMDALRYSIRSGPGCAVEVEVDLDVREPPVLPLTGGLATHGSLLVFAEVDSRPGAQTIFTVTNTNSAPAGGTILIEYIFIGSPDCLEFNRTAVLTPNDTLTALASAFNPIHAQGYLYVVAKSPVTGQPVSFNHLIGNEIVSDGIQAFSYSLDPFQFRALAAEGAPTDVDADDIRDLNGVEYEMGPDRVMIPRFLGQSANFQGSLIVIPLSGGRLFNTTVDFLIYNDNEEVFSGQRVLPCWSKRTLLQLSAAFSESFLDSTNHSPFEVLGASNLESGWFELRGLVTSSTATSIQNPTLLAVFVEGAATGEVADLPFVVGTRANGDLLPTSVLGDTTQN